MKFILALCALAAFGPTVVDTFIATVAGSLLTQVIGVEQAHIVALLVAFGAFTWTAGQLEESSMGRVLGLRQEEAL